MPFTRHHVSLPQHQWEWLAARAASLGIPNAEVLRRVIQDVMDRERPDTVAQTAPARTRRSPPAPKPELRIAPAPPAIVEDDPQRPPSDDDKAFYDDLTKDCPF